MEDVRRGAHLIKVPNNTKAIHFFINNLAFPIAVFASSEWESVQVDYLNQNYINAGFDSQSLCRWCKNHNMQFQILYPLDKLSILKNPRKYLAYLKLKGKI